MSTEKYPPASPHDSIQELFTGVFWVHGSVKIGPGMQMNRNMIIIKQGDQLTLINPVRLNDSELSKLDQLGRVHNVVRLGDFHGIDDPFYVDRYAATFWCQSGQATYKVPVATKLIEAGSATPINNSEFFIFEGALFPEAALLLKDSGLLVTTDSLQYFTDWSYTTIFTKIVLRNV